MKQLNTALDNYSSRFLLGDPHPLPAARRDAVKNRILGMPAGKAILLPAARSLYGKMLYILYLLYRLNKRLEEKREAGRILRRLKDNDFDEAVIVYDLKASPPTYGDCFYPVMLARFFLAMGKKVKFFTVNSEFRADWLRSYNEDERRAFAARLSELPGVVLKDDNCDVRTMAWADLAGIMDRLEGAERTCLVFGRKVVNREAMYYHCFNLLNRLAASLDRDRLDRFLLRRGDIESGVRIDCPKTPYVTWSVRYSEKWDTGRNQTETEFVRIHESLRSMYPRHAIMVVSDDAGCAHFRGLAGRNGLSCLFSRDFSGTFMGDCALVMGGDYYFQLRGGGMHVAAIFSRMPHYIIAQPCHETVWKKNGLTVWAGPDQVFITAAEGLPAVQRRP